jgi:DNA-binding Xre family transcriptional regulator
VAGMITPNIRTMAERRGLTTAYQLQKALPCSPSVASQLWGGEFKRVDLQTLDRLCTVLRCKPNDLLKYEAAGGA